MSILLNGGNVESEADLTAKGLISEAVGLYNHMMNVYSNGVYKFWKHPTLSPQEIANSLGQNGKELFLLHYQIGQLLNSINPGSLDSINNSIGNFTLNDNGTVTVN